MAVDASVLESLGKGDKRKQLLRYLATSGSWIVSDYDSVNLSFARSNVDYSVWKNGYVASLLVTPDFFSSLKEIYMQNLVRDVQSLGPGVVDGTEMFYGAGAIEKGENRCYLAVQLYIRSDKDKPLKDKLVNCEAKTIEIPVEITSEANKKRNRWCHSVLNLEGHDLGLVVQESSFDPDRNRTKEAVQFVLMQLNEIASKIDSGDQLDRSILPFDNVRRGESTVNLGACLHGYMNCGKPGWLKLKLHPVKRLNQKDDISETGKKWISRVLLGWSSDPEEKFFFVLPYNLEGDKIVNVVHYDLELSHVPLNGDEETVLMSQPGRRD